MISALDIQIEFKSIAVVMVGLESWSRWSWAVQMFKLEHVIAVVLSLVFAFCCSSRSSCSIVHLDPLDAV